MKNSKQEQENWKDNDYMIEDNICPRCGCCEMFWENCWSCGGEGIHDDLFEEDPLWYNPGDYEICDVCEGKGGFWICSCDENGKHKKANT